MKHLFRLMVFSFVLLCANNAHAVYVENMPVAQIQPNGDTIHFFATGDECYHRYHDANGFTIVQNQAGYWVYAMPSANGSIQPSEHLFGSIDPATIGLTPGLTISKEEWLVRRHAWDIPEQYQIQQPKTSGRNHGDFCNLVIFIRFADDTAYTRSWASIDHMFSDSTRENSSSLYNYFKHASYNKIFMRTHYAPEPDSDRILSYQSPHPRGYYMPYNDHNTIGYTNYSDRTNREFELLVGAVNFINDSFPVPTSYNLDCDNDGYIDNVNFVVKGSYTGWSDLLWPHKWNLYGHNVYINGKQVNTFNFALEGAGSEYFGVSTFCHEMFHSLGAPDLYHYNSNTEVTPVGSWDLMANNATPPQHMSAYMKYKYGNWIDSIPLITEPGTYTLHSVADSTYGNNIYRFPSTDPNQFFVVEYRDNTETFESKLPGKGLLIYRIDTRFNGNAEYDGYSYFDEVWLFRPGSNSPDVSGQISEAYFSPKSHRTEFSPSTNPYPYLTDGTRDFTFNISRISTPGNTISFYYTNRSKAANLQLKRATTFSATLAWEGIGNAYRVCYRLANSDEPYQEKLVRSKQTTITGLTSNEVYEWSVRALYDPIDDNTFADSTDLATPQTFHTELCNNPVTNTIGERTNEPHLNAPFVANEKYTYTQEIYLASELDGAQNISTIHLQYAHTTACDRSNCTIYLAHTTISSFNDTSIIPGHQLKMVYSGPLHFEQGWNEIVLDSTFLYNGEDNLVIAFDDNSGTPARAGEKFYTNTYDYSQYPTYNYYSNDENPGPEEDSISGSHSRNSYRNNIKFSGCPVGNDSYYACIISDNEDFGRVTGEGAYAPNTSITIKAIPSSSQYSFKYWNDGNTDNPRTIVLTQDTIFIAHFHSPLSIDEADEQGGFVILSQQLRVTIQGAEQEPIFIYDLMGRLVASSEPHHSDPATFNLPHSGIYVIRVGESKPVKLFVQ